MLLEGCILLEGPQAKSNTAQAQLVVPKSTPTQILSDDDEVVSSYGQSTAAWGVVVMLFQCCGKKQDG